MQDLKKTKQQLIEELRGLRDRLRELESGGGTRVHLSPGPTAAEPLGLTREAAIVNHRMTVETDAAKRENYLLRTLFDALPEFLYVKDTSSRFILANRALCHHFGLGSLQEILGKTDSDFFPSQEAKSYREQEQRLMDDCTPVVSEEEMVVGRDGPRWSLTTKIPLLDEETRRVVGLVGLNRDVTRLRLTEQARLTSEHQSRVILGAMSDAVHLVDKDFVLLFVNEAMSRWAKQAGLSGNLCGRSLREVAPFLPERVFDEYRKIFSEGCSLTTEDHFHLEGWDLVTETRRIPVFEGGRVAQVITIIRDTTEFKRTQAALDLSESLLRQMLETLPLILYSAEAGTNKTLLMRGAVKNLFGYDAEDFLGDPNFGRRFEHPEDARHIREMFVRGLASMRPFSFKYRVIHGISGEARWMHQFVVPVVDENGRLLRQDSVVIDITERELAEERLRLLSLAVEQSREGIAVADLEGRVLFLNDAFARMHDYTVAECMGQHLSRFHLPSQMPAVDAVNRRTRKEGEFAGEVWHARRDGLTFLGSMQNTLLRDREGKSAGIMATLRDITAWKEAEEQSARLAQAVSNAGEGIAIWEQDWTLSYANDAMAMILGAASTADLAGHDWASMLLPPRRSKGRGRQEVFARRSTIRRRVSATRFDGRPVSLAATLSRLPLGQRRFLIVGNIRDMTREEHYLSQLRRFGQDVDHLLEEERDRISKELHDELGQLLTAMNMGLAALRKDLGSRASALHSQVDELRDLVQKMLSSIRTLARSLRPGAPDYRTIQDSLQSLIDDLTRSKGISYTIDAKPADLDVPKSLRRVLYRIAQEALTNVVRHSDATRCRIILRRAGNKLILRIKDNGRNATPEALEGRSSLGIMSMKERASASGGTLRVSRMSDGGVCVAAQFPSGSWTEGEHDKDTNRR